MDPQVARARLPAGAGLPRRERDPGRGRRGQSLTEFALTLPVVLLLVLFGLDFGRVFLGWVTLTNAVREGANYAAMNPAAWGAVPNLAVQAEYARLVTTEAAGANCTMPATVPDPTFPSGTTLGSPADVSITCRFSLITPVISSIVGNTIGVTASSAFPVRAGLIEGIPTPAPTASPTASPSPSESASPSPTPSPSASPSPSATPMCIVPNMWNVLTDSATATWTGAGFTAQQLVFSPLVGPNNNYHIKDQSLVAGTSVACSSSMTVYDKVQH
jgi:Flp pilus assembly protein TadG